MSLIVNYLISFVLRMIAMESMNAVSCINVNCIHEWYNSISKIQQQNSNFIFIAFIHTVRWTSKTIIFSTIYNRIQYMAIGSDFVGMAVDSNIVLAKMLVTKLLALMLLDHIYLYIFHIYLNLSFYLFSSNILFYKFFQTLMNRCSAIF